MSTAITLKRSRRTSSGSVAASSIDSARNSSPMGLISISSLLKGDDNSLWRTLTGTSVDVVADADLKAARVVATAASQSELQIEDQKIRRQTMAPLQQAARVVDGP